MRVQRSADIDATEYAHLMQRAAADVQRVCYRKGVDNGVRDAPTGSRVRRDVKGGKLSRAKTG